ncbi:MAG: hypothetical protein ACKO3W_14305, partial [bacterium]
MLPRTTFIRLLSSCVLSPAMALAAPIVGTLQVAHTASAQMSRSVPSPISATDFARMLTECGLPETVRDVALPLHEGYFARFREFEAREVEPALDRTASGDFVLSATLDGAKETRDTRRRLFQRAAQMDAQLVDELVGVLTAEDAVRAERLRDALSRRRSATMIGGMGFLAGATGRPETFDLRTTEALRTLDATAREAVAPSFDAYGIELTRALERAADARLDVAVKAAELRAERNIPQTPMREPAAGDANGQPADTDNDSASPAIEEDWFRRNAEIQREASAELGQVMLRVRRIHRDTLTNIEPLVPPTVARAMRADLVRAVYPGLKSKNAFDAALAEANGLRAKGRIDDARWSAADAIIDGHDVAVRGVLGELMDLADRQAGDGEPGFIAFGSTGEDSKPSEDAVRAERLRQELGDLAARDAEALRAALGLEAAPPQVAVGGRPIEVNGVDISAAIGEAVGGVVGGAVGGEGGVQIQAVMVGGDGEMITLSQDDMDDSGMMFVGGLAGSGPRVPKPMTREELDTLAARAGL